MIYIEKKPISTNTDRHAVLHTIITPYKNMVKTYPEKSQKEKSIPTCDMPLILILCVTR